jgi:hypothetical protein
MVVVRRFFLGLRLEGAALRLLGHIGRVKVSAAGSHCNPLNPRVSDALAGYSSG